ncbi:MAG TPA: arginine deiminase-related protein [Edaphocola sp.]|nr:arginine deiminase-related protein [Edaphocola sp.]
MNYSLLMIRPIHFGYNAETAINNAFQEKVDQDGVQEKALKEFDNFVSILRNHDIDVFVVEDTVEPHTPDSIFPNNWITFHKNGTIILYPMFAVNRRLERKDTVLEEIKNRYNIKHTIDYSTKENQNIFLEGTGSIILDRNENKAYACLSPRTDKELFLQFCKDMNYEPVYFYSVDMNGNEIYHTNVMMCVADKYAVVCMESIKDKNEYEHLKTSLEQSGKVIVPISYNQMNHFAGNMLQVKNKKEETFLVMSTQAYDSLNSEQIKTLEQFDPIIHAPINTIEQNGGGSARCMMAEIYLSKKIIL